jgi:Leucine-rich repeat (LRR) protein
LLLGCAGASAGQDPPKDQPPMVAKGLAWLVKAQHKDGYWEGSDPFAMTALAGIALLAEGSTPIEGTFKDELNRTVNWLVAQRRKSGLFCSADEFQKGRYMYSHGFTLLFLASVHQRCDPANHDAAARRDRSQMARLRKNLEPVLAEAVAFSAKAQSSFGGWYYVSAAEGIDTDELNQTALQLQALEAVRACGIEVPARVLERARTYLDKSIPKRGRPFDPKPLPNQPPAVAAALAAIMSAGEFDSPMVKKWLPYCPKNAKDFGPMDMEHYFHLHYAQVMHRLGDKGYAKLLPDSAEPRTWSAYRKTLWEQAAKVQHKDGNWFSQFGPVYATACYLIALQVEKGYFPARAQPRQRLKFVEPTPAMLEDANKAIRDLRGKFYSDGDIFEICVVDMSVLSNPDLAKFPDLPFRFELWLRANEIPEQKSLGALKRLSALTRLRLFGIHWTGKHWNELAAMEELRQLEVRNALNIGDVDWTPLKRLTSLSLGSTQASGKGFKALTQLQYLYLDSSKITEEGMREIGSLSELKALDLRGTPITDDMMAHLAASTNLRRLVLAQPRISDRGLEHLAGLKNLTSLELYNANVSGKGLKALTRLQQLTLDGSKITNDDLREIGTLKDLKVLDLRNNPISDEGIAHLANLTSLDRLAIPSTKITDRGLEHLVGLKSLRHLDLIDTQVTRTGVEKFKKAMPNVTLATDRKISIS